jgi:hypothetical protein
MTESEESEGRVSRRTALKRIGAAGAVVWVTPVISSVTTPANAASPPPGSSTCCTCNCSDENGRVVLQSCNPGVVSSSECEAVCREFCESQERFPEAVGFVDCATGTSTCQPTVLPGATGEVCVCP